MRVTYSASSTLPGTDSDSSMCPNGGKGSCKFESLRPGNLCRTLQANNGQAR